MREFFKDLIEVGERVFYLVVILLCGGGQEGTGIKALVKLDQVAGTAGMKVYCMHLSRAEQEDGMVGNGIGGEVDGMCTSPFL